MNVIAHDVLVTEMTMTGTIGMIKNLAEIQTGRMLYMFGINKENDVNFYELQVKNERLTKREGKHTVRIGNEWRRHDPVWDRLAEYEDIYEQTGLTPKEVIDVIRRYRTICGGGLCEY